MEALEVRTIFAPYYLWQIESGAEDIFAHGYILSLDRVMNAQFIRIVDEMRERAVIEARIGARTHIAKMEWADRYARMRVERRNWMEAHGHYNVLEKYLPLDKHNPEDPSRMIAKGRILVELGNPTLIDLAPLTKKVRRKEQYVKIGASASKLGAQEHV